MAESTRLGRYHYLFGIGLLGLLLSFGIILPVFGTGFEGLAEWYSF